MKNISLYIIFFIALLPNLHADFYVEPTPYEIQQSSCRRGNTLAPYQVVHILKYEPTLDKLQAILENDCLAEHTNSIGMSIADFWALDLDKYALDEKIRLLIDSPWLTQEMQDQLGLTAMDLALIKEDPDAFAKTLKSIPNLRRISPPEVAQFVRFLSLLDRSIQRDILLKNGIPYRIKDGYIQNPKNETVILISGPGKKAWSYSVLSHYIKTLQKLGLNWIILGNGVDLPLYPSVTLEEIKSIKPWLKNLQGNITFIITAHGSIEKSTDSHKITLNKYESTYTKDLFKTLKQISDNRPIDVILDSCYSGFAYKDAFKYLPHGSRFFSSAPVDDTSSSSTKLMLNGVNKFMTATRPVNSFFELSNIYCLSQTLGVNKGPQVLTFTSHNNPELFFLDHYDIDLLYLFENFDGIVTNYLYHYLDKETFDQLVDFTQEIAENCTVTFTDFKYDNKKNLARILQFAISIHKRKHKVLDDGICPPHKLNKNLPKSSPLRLVKTKRTFWDTVSDWKHWLWSKIPFTTNLETEKSRAKVNKAEHYFKELKYRADKAYR